MNGKREERGDVWSYDSSRPMRGGGWPLRTTLISHLRLKQRGQRNPKRLSEKTLASRVDDEHRDDERWREMESCKESFILIVPLVND